MSLRDQSLLAMKWCGDNKYNKREKREIEKETREEDENNSIHANERMLKVKY